MSLIAALLCACQLGSGAESDSTAAARLVELARTQRYQQDSALGAYTAIARQRWSAGIGLAATDGLGPLGRTRLAARFESVSRVRWGRGIEPTAELLAGRGVAPIAGEYDPEPATAGIVFTLPYAPNRDRLWPMSEVADARRGAAEWISHPLAAGSDSLYRFSLGGQLTLTLPSGTVVPLRELFVTPRYPAPHLIVGSFWLDERSGALVRAAYRPSHALDLLPFLRPDPTADDERVAALFGPLRGRVEEIVVEHGLFAERFWLPRARAVRGEGTAKMGRVTISIEQSFTYESVVTAASGTAPAPAPLSADARRRTRERVSGTRLTVFLPADQSTLVTNEHLSPSIFDASEEFFTDTDFERLRREVSGAIAMQRQAEWAPQPMEWTWGPSDGMLRFNRVEGLSVGLRGDRPLGRGYAISGSARIGSGDWEPGAELGLRRTGSATVYRAGLYRRLAAANDWGHPLGLMSSANALFAGNDYGVYFRSHGVELGSRRMPVESGSVVEWRAFVERQEPAHLGPDQSLAHWLGGGRFAENPKASAGTYSGVESKVVAVLGLNPRRLQVSGELAAEAAHGPLRYARVRAESRIARGLWAHGHASAVLAAGTSSGALPVQRRFYLGGPASLHAHQVGEVQGESFWLTRGELGWQGEVLRRGLFIEQGWAGARREFTRAGTRSAAAGLSLSVLDGLVRLDASARIEGRPRWTLDLAVDVR